MLTSVIAVLPWLASCTDRAASRPGAPLTPLVTFGEPGTQPGQFAYPRAMDFALGSLWVIDKTSRIQRLDPRTGACLASWRTPAMDLGKPTGVTVEADGDDALIWVADTHYHRVLLYRLAPGETEASLQSQFGCFGRGPGEFIYPTDVAIQRDPATGALQRIYVSEYGGNDRVSVFGPGVLRGEPDFLFGFTGAAPCARGFDRPQSLALSAREIVVADSCNHRLGRFTPDGDLIAWIDLAAEGQPGLNYPYAVILLADGSALVCEFGGSRLQRIDLRTGTSIGVYGSPGRDTGELANPWALARDGDTCYVLDSGNSRVLGFRLPVHRLAIRGGDP